MQQQSNGPAVIIQPATKVTYPVHEKCVLGISISILVLGASCITLQIAGSATGIGLGAAGAGIWSGVWVRK